MPKEIPQEWLDDEFSSEVTGFTPSRTKEIVDALDIQEVGESMIRAGLPAENVENVIRGEIGRIMSVSSSSHNHFIGAPLALMQRSGMETEKALELGIGLAAHWGIYKGKQPGIVIGIEKEAPRAAAAKVVVDTLINKGLLSRDIDIRPGDHTLEVSDKVDFVISSLVSQYDPKEIPLWLASQDVSVVNGDYCFGFDPATEQGIADGLIPVMSFSGKPSGFVWQLNRKINETVMGETWEADFVHSADKENIIVGRIPGATTSTRVMIFEGKDGNKYVEGWGLMPEEDFVDELLLHNMAAVRATIQEVWAGDNRSGKAVLETPLLASERDKYTVVVPTTSINLPLEAPLYMLLQNFPTINRLVGQGHGFEFIGKGKMFTNAQEFLGMVQQVLGDRSYEKFILTSPPHVVTITTSDQKVFEQIVATAT